MPLTRLDRSKPIMDGPVRVFITRCGPRSPPYPTTSADAQEGKSDKAFPRSAAREVRSAGAKAYAAVREAGGSTAIRNVLRLRMTSRCVKRPEALGFVLKRAVVVAESNTSMRTRPWLRYYGAGDKALRFYRLFNQERAHRLSSTGKISFSACTPNAAYGEGPGHSLAWGG